MARAVGEGQGDIFQALTAHRDQLSSVQSKMVERAPKEQREFLTAQFQLENEAQVTEMISKMLKDEEGMAIARNLA
jgi:phosphoenolpyruvate-protein kinase (PTS system EI component)